jgi:hypothetical protein
MPFFLFFSKVAYARNFHRVRMQLLLHPDGVKVALGHLKLHLIIAILPVIVRTKDEAIS